MRPLHWFSELIILVINNPQHVNVLFASACVGRLIPALATVGRAFNSGAVDSGSILCCVIPKTLKDGVVTSSLGVQHWRYNGWGGETHTAMSMAIYTLGNTWLTVVWFLIIHHVPRCERNIYFFLCVNFSTSDFPLVSLHRGGSNYEVCFMSWILILKKKYSLNLWFVQLILKMYFMCLFLITVHIFCSLNHPVMFDLQPSPLSQGCQVDCQPLILPSRVSVISQSHPHQVGQRLKANVDLWHMTQLIYL